MTSNSQILLSIIIPVYNLENRIKKCLDSIIPQLNSKIEVVIVNDGSTDNSLNVINHLIEDHRVDHSVKIISTENQGVGEARNKGLDLSKGGYVYFLDGDDFISHNFVEILMENIFNHQDAEAFTFGFNRINEKNQMISFFDNYSKLNEKVSGHEILNHIVSGQYWVWTASIVYKKDILIKMSRRYGVYSQGQDIHFNYITLLYVKKAIFINEILAYYYYRSDSATNTPRITKLDTFYMRLDLQNKIVIQNSDRKFDSLLHYNQRATLDSLRQVFTFLYINSLNKLVIKKNILKKYPNIIKDYHKVLKNYKGKEKTKFVFFYITFKYNLYRLYMLARNIKFLVFKPQD